MLNIDKNELKKHFTKIYKNAPGFSGICYRGVWKEYADQHSVIQASGSFIAGGRYNVEADFGVLYLSCDPKTCIEEAVRSIHIYPNEMAGKLPRMILGLKVELSKVLKLSKESVLGHTNLRKMDLLDLDWVDKKDKGEEIITQTVGRIARDTKFEAILVPSARRDGCNLNIFPDNLHPTSKITLVNINGLYLSDVKYNEARSKSLEAVINRIGKKLNEVQEKTMFCPPENIICK